MKFIVFAILVVLLAFAHSSVAVPINIQDLVVHLQGIADAGGSIDGSS